MSKATREVWHCDICGWEWLPDTNKVPERCPNRKCRKRNWNAAVERIDAKFLGRLPNGEVDYRVDVTYACPDCGGMKGLHQKGCKAKSKKSTPSKS